MTDNGISKTAIYAPRHEALDQLSGIPLLVTLALETRDAIVPRVRAAISFLGRSVVYVLTEIIGRSIGFIGCGIIKGIGNACKIRSRIAIVSAGGEWEVKGERSGKRGKV